MLQTVWSYFYYQGRGLAEPEASRPAGCFKPNLKNKCSSNGMKITFISFCETSLKDYFVSKCNFYSLEQYLRQSSPWGLGFGLKRPAGREASGSARPLSWLQNIPSCYDNDYSQNWLQNRTKLIAKYPLLLWSWLFTKLIAGRAKLIAKYPLLLWSWQFTKLIVSRAKLIAKYPLLPWSWQFTKLIAK